MSKMIPKQNMHGRTYSNYGDVASRNSRRETKELCNASIRILVYMLHMDVLYILNCALSDLWFRMICICCNYYRREALKQWANKAKDKRCKDLLQVCCEKDLTNVADTICEALEYKAASIEGM